MTETPPTRIISASRRTDLPGYHADECAARLSRLRKPVHSVFFWTRYPAGLLTGALGEAVRFSVSNPLVHLTVTGLGGSALEPNVPATDAVVRSLDPLIRALRGEPRRLIWRYDPVLVEAMSLDDFDALARQFGGRGVRRVVMSFPAHLSLKGALDSAYRRFGLRRHDRAERRDRALAMAEVAQKHGLTLAACCQPKLLADCVDAITPARCIDADLAAELHPDRFPLDLGKDPTQRRHCHCAVSHDIGRYTDLCESGCAYCYSKAGGPLDGR